MTEPFGAMLESLRKKRHHSRESLAAAAGVSPSMIRDLERGGSQAPRPNNIARLADALRLDGAERAEFEAAAAQQARQYARKDTTPRKDTDSDAAVHALPRDIRSFTGRQAQVDSIVRAAGQPAGGVAGLFAIEGRGGIGKTTLAVHAAYRIREEFPDRFPDGYVFVDLRGYSGGPALTDHQARRLLLRMMDIPAGKIPEDRLSREQFYQSTVAGKRALIILDSAHSVAQVKPLLAGTGNCLVIVTSRERFRSLDDATIVYLEEFATAEAITLLRAIADPGRADDAELAAKVVRLCDYVPLFIRMVAARLSHGSVETLNDVHTQLSGEHTRLAYLRDPERSAAAVFRSSLRYAERREARLFRLLALIPGPDFDAYAAASLTGDALRVTRTRLESLLDRSLLIQRTSGRYQFHDLVRVFASSLKEPGSEQATENLLNFYLRAAQLADRAFDPGLPRADSADEGPAPQTPPLRTPAQAQAWIAVELPNLLAASRLAGRVGQPHIISGLSAALSDYLRAHGPWKQALILHWAALKAATSGKDRPHMAEALRSIGGVQSRTGDIVQSQHMLGNALRIYRDLNDKRGIARVLIELGIAQRVAGDARSLDGFTEALGIYRELGELRGQAAALTELASVQWQQGPLPDAESNLAEALRIYRELRNQQGEAAALLYLGNVQAALGATEAALETLGAAEKIGRELGQPILVANSLLYLGDVQRAAGRPADAEISITSASTLYRQLEHRQGMATAHAYLGETLTLTGQHEEADDHFRQALRMFHQIGDPNGLAETLNAYAALAMATHVPKRARTRYTRALTLAVSADSERDEAEALTGLGNVHTTQGEQEAARARYTEALTIYQKMGSRPDIDRLHRLLSRLTLRTVAPPVCSARSRRPSPWPAATW